MVILERIELEILTIIGERVYLTKEFALNYSNGG